MRLLKRIVNEEINFHYGTFASNDKKIPEYSDSIFVMSGRGTGHFGSGVYFATYHDEKELDDHRYGREAYFNKGLSQVDGSLVMLDLDNVPNMFRVSNSRIAEHLFKTLKSINNYFYAVYSNIEEEKKSGKNIKDAFESVRGKYIHVYRLIRSKFSELGIDVPDINTFSKELYSGIEDYSNRFNQKEVSRQGSMSTRIMTLLGYSGVDVSGVKGWDNTTHGSVVYDIYNISNLIQKVDQKNARTPNEETKEINPYQLREMSYDQLKTFFSRVEDINIKYLKYEMLDNRSKRVYNSEMIKRLKNTEIYNVDINRMDVGMIALFQKYIPELPNNSYSEVFNYDTINDTKKLQLVKRLLVDGDIDDEDLYYNYAYELFKMDFLSDYEYNLPEDEKLKVIKNKLSLVD